MERRHVLMLVGVLLIAGLGLTSRMYINRNVEFINGMTPAEYRQKLANYRDKKVPFDEINRSPESFRGEEIIVKGRIDIALMQEDRYIVYPLLEREKKLYFTDCEGEEPLSDSAYVRGVFQRLESKNAYDTETNLTEEERNKLELAREKMKEYNYSVPDYMDNQTEYLWGIKCREILPAN